MYSIVLITDKQTKQRMILSFSNEKEIAVAYSPRMYFNEILEKVKDNVEERILFWCKQYQIGDNVKIRKRRPKGLKYNWSESAKEKMRERMLTNNPSYTTWDDNRRMNQSVKMRGNRISAVPKKDEWKQWMSEWMKQYACVKGYKWCYNRELDKETRIPPHSVIPDGYNYGRLYESVEGLLTGRYWY